MNAIVVGRLVRRRRGLALVMAIVVLGLLGVFLTVLARHALLQDRRTAAAGDDAQATQLLSAAVHAAEDQLAAGARVDGPVATPVGRVTLAWAAASGRTCAVAVACGQARRAVTVHFANGRVIGVD